MLLLLARVRLLLKKGHSCYRPRRTGERKRKSVRGCIVDQNLSALALIVVRKGEKEIEGLTDVNVPRRLGPKRASHIRKLFALSKEDDVRKYVIKRPLPLKEGKTKQRFQAPKIQRLVTPVVLQVRFNLICKKLKITYFLFCSARDTALLLRSTVLSRVRKPRQSMLNCWLNVDARKNFVNVHEHRHYANQRAPSRRTRIVARNQKLRKWK